jgi:hypothetical protein
MRLSDYADAGPVKRPELSGRGLFGGLGASLQPLDTTVAGFALHSFS